MYRQLPHAPRLAAYVTTDGVCSKVWCAWCIRWHVHGHCGAGRPLGAGDGHRTAHCHGNTSSPYHHTGYVLVEVGWWPDRPRWNLLPVICRPCGRPFTRGHPSTRYCSTGCRRNARAAA